MLRHIKGLRDGTHYNEHLQRAWIAYGEKSFYYLILERCPPEDCLEREQFWINRLRAADNRTGFNACPTAGSCLGRRNNDQTKAKMSESAKKRHQRLPHPWLGKRHTPETRAKISAANKGQGLGQHPSLETRAKLSEAHRGSKRSLETRMKMSMSQLGHAVTDEARAKMSATKRSQGKLTPSIRAEIKFRYVPGHPRNGQAALAREFGVSRCAIQKALEDVCFDT